MSRASLLRRKPHRIARDGDLVVILEDDIAYS
jgi:hypothetical protein